ncbi:sigma-54-dependent transcriptional regulator [Mesonia sediminis]|uniref:Sigma-54-dependent transcriptional regulator n=1 Tax=Mesonia sediminis TaxID=1703946 RepID=A0ABW5SF15_9FLAO
MNRILIVEDDLAFCQMLATFLTKKGFEVTTCTSAEQAHKELDQNRFDVLLTDVRLPEKQGTVLLDRVQQNNWSTKVILMTGYAEVSKAVEVMKSGAFDYIAKPVNPEKLLASIKNALKELQGFEKSAIKQTTKAHKKSDALISESQKQKYVQGVSKEAKTLADYIDLVAPTDFSVLIVGQSGTGKEYVAKKIHHKSKRGKKAFVAVDCGAIPKELAVSEFFGHVKGSFTGAIQDKVGHFEAANGGTLFLDEIGNLSYELQIHLLRALQERVIKPIGSHTEIPVDIRVIAATNENLDKAVAAGDFREDLYHRLNEFSIQIPALAERKEDLVLFANHFLSQANQILNKQILGFTDEAMSKMEGYSWPGNLRELQNCVKRASLIAQNDYIEETDLPKEILVKPEPQESYSLFKNKNEVQLIKDTLAKTGGNKSKTARLLQIDRKTLYNKLKQYNIEY